MEKKVTWEKAEVASDSTKEKQNANEHSIGAAEKRTRRGSRTFEKYPSFIRLYERVIFDITSLRLSIDSDRLTFCAKSGCINVSGVTQYIRFLGTSKDNIFIVSLSSRTYI